MGNTDLSPGMDMGSHGSVMTVKISGKVLTAAVIFLFLFVFFAIFLYFYVKEHWIRRFADQSRTQLIITTAVDAPIPRRGLSRGVLRSLPSAEFRRCNFKDGIECSVCLCELSEGEKFRLLPKCNHGFHLDCIDMWLHSHFTCPVCRSPVGPVASGEGEVFPVMASGQPSSESPALPTNMLFWRNNGRFNTRGLSLQSERSLVISIPNRFAEELPNPISIAGTSRCSGENLTSPVEEMRSPATSKFRSLKRILSRGKRSSGSCCSSPVEGDIEQGLGRCGVVREEGSSNVSKTLHSN
ncbi:RING-H2 finger protein ATL3-like [Phalaenopsis equestris]|uniref:RING-H2 finger protein ATL3-like n=1 Tax=Phalaenopsis equestris TaxID=78828 RepID=UPI0009E28580|nr:RING-H2 finger protein ATL3-like [Phalaenopsis equestris]